jgi:nucleoside-diphosphate-sugar epimerase
VPLDLSTDRIALTGASGFIGGALSRSLNERGAPVRVLARNPDQLTAMDGAEVVQGSLEDQDSLRRLVDGTDVVIHCAGAIKARSGKEFTAINAGGTERLAEAIARTGARTRLMLVSSLAAREPALSPYAASKAAAEAVLARNDPELEYCVVRPPAVYGPGDRSTLGLFRQLVRGYAIVPWRVQGRFSLIYIDDLVAAMERLLAVPKWNGSVIEPDDGRADGYSWTDLAEIASAHLGRPVRCLSVPFQAVWLPVAVNEAVSTVLGKSPMLTKAKLRELFHPDWVCKLSRPRVLDEWQPRTRFKEGFERTLLWYKRQDWL